MVKETSFGKVMKCGLISRLGIHKNIDISSRQKFPHKKSRNWTRLRIANGMIEKLFSVCYAMPKIKVVRSKG